MPGSPHRGAPAIDQPANGRLLSGRADAAEATLRAILAAAPLPLIAVDLEGRVLSWNAAAERLFGWRADEVVGRPLPVVPPERADEPAAIRDRVLAGGPVEGIETRRRRRDGTLVDVSLSVVPLRAGDGAVRGLAGFVTEVTDPAGGEEAAQRLAAIVRNSDDAIVGKDLRSIITSWNPAAERMFGFTAAEAVGRPITLIIPPDHRHEEDMVLARLVEGETIDHFETVRMRKDGTRLDVSLTVSPIRNAAGRIVGASKIARDIGERKAAERERAALLIRERAARAQAEEANRLKDEFLAVLSHELRTPLTSAHGWTRLLQTQPFDEARLRKALDVIARSVDLQLRLVNDLLDLSALAVGKIRLECRPVDLAAVVRGALDAFRGQAAQAAIDLVESIQPVGIAHVDPARVEQIIANLVGNALKFTGAGGRVEVRVDRQDGGARIAVADTGRGIDPAFLPHVFDKFRQGEASTTRRVGGLGLGLAIVRSLVELHGGRVTAESEGPGRGSVFTVWLPLETPR